VIRVGELNPTMLSENNLEELTMMVVKERMLKLRMI
jgi:hypothetical protein